MLISAIRKKESFSLLELIIVIGVLAILGTVVTTVLNPIELFAQARDANRVVELRDIHKAIQLYRTAGNTNLGALNTVYISVPDTSLTCANIALPSLPAGWVYHCVTSANIQKIDGNGWLPINFTSVANGVSFAKLPTDSSNSAATGLYYAYARGSSPDHWALATLLTSEKALRTTAVADLGYDPTRFEIGTDLTIWKQVLGLLAYWPYEVNGTDVSGNNINGALTGGLYTDTGKVNQGIHFVATGGSINFGKSSLMQITGPITITFWAKEDVNPPLNDRYILTKSNVTNRGWAFSFAPGPIARFRISPDGTALITATTANLPAMIGQWYHFAGVYEPGVSLRVYVNGAVAVNNTTAIPASQYNNATVDVTGGLETGCGSCYYPAGVIDEVHVYNRALTDQEINAIYKSEK